MSREAKYFLFFIVSAIAVIKLYPLLEVKYSYNDSIWQELASGSFQEAMDLISGIARMQGRLFAYWTLPLVIVVPFLFKSLVYYKIVNYILIGVTLAGLWWGLKALTRSTLFSVTLVTVFFVLLQNNLDHNLLLSDLGCHQIAIFTLFLSFGYFIYFFTTQDKKYLVISVLLFAFNLTIYEIYVPFTLVFPLLALLYLSGRERERPLVLIWHSLKSCRWHFVALGLYLVFYFTYRYYFPSQYARSAFNAAGFSLKGFFDVLWTFSSTSLPGSLLFDPKYWRFFTHYSVTLSGFPTDFWGILLSLHRSLGSVWLVKALLGGCALGFLWYKTEDIFNLRTFLAALLIGFAFLVLPNVSYGISSYIQMEVREGHTIGRQYVYAGYLGVVVIICSLVAGALQLLRNHIWLRRVFVVLATSAVVGLGLMTDYSDYFVNRFLQIQNSKWLSVIDFVKAGGLEEVPPGARIYAPRLFRPPYYVYYAVTSFNNNYWGKYLTMISGKKVFVFRNLQNRKAGGGIGGESYPATYFLGYRLDPDTRQRFIVFAKLDPVVDPARLTTSFVSVYVFGNRKPFVISLHSAEGDFKIHAARGLSVRGPAGRRLKTKLIDSDTCRKVLIQSDGIDLKRLFLYKEII